MWCCMIFLRPCPLVIPIFARCLCPCLFNQLSYKWIVAEYGCLFAIYDSSFRLRLCHLIGWCPIRPLSEPPMSFLKGLLLLRLVVMYSYVHCCLEFLWTWWPHINWMSGCMMCSDHSFSWKFYCFVCHDFLYRSSVLHNLVVAIVCACQLALTVWRTRGRVPVKVGRL